MEQKDKVKYLLDGEETERLFFRKISFSDFDSWLEFFKDPMTRHHWIGEVDSPEKECEKWYQNQMKRHKESLGGLNALVEKDTGKLVGHCGLLVQMVDETTELEIGYSLLPEFWCRGFATEAATRCKNHAFENNFSESLISIISLTNVPSQKVAFKNGMRIVKTTVFKNNRVYIFRVQKTEWLKEM